VLLADQLSNNISSITYLAALGIADCSVSSFIFVLFMRRHTTFTKPKVTAIDKITFSLVICQPVRLQQLWDAEVNYKTSGTQYFKSNKGG
jgi:hypothetical protein